MLQQQQHKSASDNTTKLATTAYVTTAIANLNDSAPSALNTLNELAAALNDDASFSSTITTALGTKLPLAGGTMTGNIAHASDFALDVGGNITLDADGGSVFFKDGGTEFFKARKVGTSHIQLYSAQNDVDIKIEGVDGGVGIAALTLDMSEAGFAIFNSGGSFGGTGALRIPQGTTGQRPSAATGQMRWNTTDGALEVYNGSAWTAVGTGSSNKILDTFTADGSTTDFTLSVTPANEDALIVFIDGVYQEKGDYALTNAVLALDTAPASGEKIAVHITTASVHDGTSATNQQFTATAGQTAFTLSADPKSENNTQVYINGVYQQKTDYTVSGTTLTFDTGLTVGDVVEVNAFTVATLGNTDTVSEGTTNLYHTTARARSAISVSGNALSYNSSTGVITSAYEESPTFTGNAVIDGTLSVSTVVKLGTWSQDGQTNAFIGFDQGSSDVGLGFGHSAGTGRVYYPARENGSGVSDVIGLGTSTYKYKDLHLSGIASIGNLKIGTDQGSDGQVITSTGSGVAWENIPSDVTVSNTAPSSPSEGDLWFDSTAGTKALNVWSGTIWKILSSIFNASGGTKTTFGGYTIHAFTSSGTFTPAAAGLVDILVVGGGGGSNDGRFSNEGTWDGGGGAGGLRYLTSQTVTAQAYTITIGAGGGKGANGGNSSGLGITSLGGGYGGESGSAGAAGGSGGGGGGDVATSAGAGTSGQGNAGGPGTDPGGNPYYEQAGGGGGAGEAGNTDGLGFGGDGQDYSTIFGTTYGESGWFAGGGAGGSGTDGTGAINDGGQGGGGDSGVGYTIASSAGVAGAANTGGGGGGGRYSKTGGSGIVLIRYT